MAYEFNYWNDHAAANCPLPELLEGIAQYGQLGIPPSQLVIALPWYGYDYTCQDDSIGSPCKLVPAQARWVPRPPQINYADALFLLRNGSSPTGQMYDHKTASAWFDYVDPETGQRHQVWFDTPGSLAVKIAALNAAGVRGISWWHTGSVKYGTTDGQAAAMWDAMATMTGVLTQKHNVTALIRRTSRPHKTDDAVEAQLRAKVAEAEAALRKELARRAKPKRKIDTWFGWYGNYSETLAAVEPYIDSISSLSMGLSSAPAAEVKNFSADMRSRGIDTYYLMGGDQTWFCAEFAGPTCDGLSTDDDGCRCTNPHNDSARNKSIVHILKTVEAYGVTGIDIDFEHLPLLSEATPNGQLSRGIPTNNVYNESRCNYREAYSIFLDQLSSALHAKGYKLSECVGYCAAHAPLPAGCFTRPGPR